MPMNIQNMHQSLLVLKQTIQHTQLAQARQKTPLGGAAIAKMNISELYKTKS